MSGTAPAMAAGTGRPLTTCIDAIQDAIGQALDAGERQAGYRAIARLSGHLAAMARTVHPHVTGQPGGQLREMCLQRARELERALWLLERHLSGAACAAGLPLAIATASLHTRLAGYRSAEQALVSWVEDRLTTDGQERLTREYRRALGCGPTRPHPRWPRSGPLRLAFRLRGCWDRLLDVTDARPGMGRDFAPLLEITGSRAMPAPPGDSRQAA